MTLFTLKFSEHRDVPERKRTYNQALFTEVAPRYDFVVRMLSLGRDAEWKKRLVRSLSPLAPSLCADLACGTGDITRLLAQAYPKATVVGVDLTEPMLRRACQQNHCGKVLYLQGDTNHLPFRDGSIDLITGGYALRNAPDLTTLLREVRRVLKPRGVAAFLDFSKPPGRWAQSLELNLLRLWGGLWGWLLHRNPEVYGYIAASLETFPDRNELRAMTKCQGFELETSRRFFGGILEMLILKKIGDRPMNRSMR